MRLSLGSDNICIKVYNPKTQQLIAVFDSYKKASARLGVRAERISEKVSNKKRMYSPVLDMQIAVRMGVKTKEMDVLIEKTNKYKPL